MFINVCLYVVVLEDGGDTHSRRYVVGCTGLRVNPIKQVSCNRYTSGWGNPDPETDTYVSICSCP